MNLVYTLVCSNGDSDTMRVYTSRYIKNIASVDIKALYMEYREAELLVTVDSEDPEKREYAMLTLWENWQYADYPEEHRQAFTLVRTHTPAPKKGEPAIPGRGVLKAWLASIREMIKGAHESVDIGEIPVDISKFTAVELYILSARFAKLASMREVAEEAGIYG